LISTLFFAVLVAGMPVHAFEKMATNEMEAHREANEVSINWSLGSLGFGGLFPFAIGGASFEGSLSVLDIGVEHNRSNLGMTFSPFSIFAWVEENSESSYFSLFNLTVYWNAVSHRGLFFGPFATVNYMLFDDAFQWNRYMFTAGLRGGIRMETNWMNMHVFSMETGFRIVDGKGNFFVGAKIDLLPLLASWFLRDMWIVSHWWW